MTSHLRPRNPVIVIARSAVSPSIPRTRDVKARRGGGGESRDNVDPSKDYDYPATMNQRPGKNVLAPILPVRTCRKAALPAKDTTTLAKNRATG